MTLALATLATLPSVPKLARRNFGNLDAVADLSSAGGTSNIKCEFPQRSISPAMASPSDVVGHHASSGPRSVGAEMCGSTVAEVRRSVPSCSELFDQLRPGQYLHRAGVQL